MPKRRRSTKPAAKAKREKKEPPCKGVAAFTQAEEIPRPDLYATIPKQSKKRKPGQLTKRQLEEYFDKGFIVLEDFIDHKILDEVRQDISDQVNDLAEKLYKAGKITNKHEDKELQDRLIHLDKEYPGAAVVLHKSDYLSPAFQKLWGYDKLLNVMEQLVGPEVSGHPEHMIQFVTLAQLAVDGNPRALSPDKMDNAYFEASAINTFLASAWIPFVDTNARNGCMQMIPYGHHQGKTATHTCCAGGTWYVDVSEEVLEKELDLDTKDAVTCEVPYGGLVLFNNCIPHRSLDNLTGAIRWSVDFRFLRTGDPTQFGEPIVMRTAKDPKLKIDWSPITEAKVGRIKQGEQQTGMNHDELDPTVSGPWMLRWKIVNHNKHTAQHEKAAAACKP